MYPAPEGSCPTHFPLPMHDRDGATAGANVCGPSRFHCMLWDAQLLRRPQQGSYLASPFTPSAWLSSPEVLDLLAAARSPSKKLLAAMAMASCAGGALEALGPCALQSRFEAAASGADAMVWGSIGDSRALNAARATSMDGTGSMGSKNCWGDLVPMRAVIARI